MTDVHTGGTMGLVLNIESIFEWDEKKNFLNIEKHGIDFHQAKSIFFGKTISREVIKSNINEKRFITFGKLENVILIAVIHTDREGNIRIISARKASRKERGIYEKATQGKNN